MSIFLSLLSEFWPACLIYPSETKKGKSPAAVSGRRGYPFPPGGKRIIRLTSVIVPFMGVFYIIISLIVILVHIRYVPAMFVEIFSDASAASSF